jgi:hypothetical protein
VSFLLAGMTSSGSIVIPAQAGIQSESGKRQQCPATPMKGDEIEGLP